MRNKLLLIALSIALVLSFVPIDALQAAGSIMPTDNTTITNHNLVTKYRVGDKVVFGTGLVGTLQSIDAKTNKGVFKATIDAPKYLDDLKTTVKTDWIAIDNGYKTKDNLFDAVVQGSKTTVNYSGKSITWEPELIVQNKVIDVSSTALLYDQLNGNYGRNTVVWFYENGISRYLRQIEGVLMDYYVLYGEPQGDIVIRDNIEKKNGYNYDTEPFAYDADNRPVKITTENGMKIVSLADLKDAKYPVTIDPTNNYVTSASDGYNRYGLVASYSTAHDAASATTTNAASSIGYLGQDYDSGDKLVARFYTYFDTSDLPDTAIISAATLSIYLQTDDTVTDFDITVCSGMPTYPHDPLVAGDFDYTKYTSGGGTLTTAGISTAAYSAITLSATGLGWINTTGYTKFTLRSSRDISSTSPTNSEWIILYTYEQGAGYRPKLDVTYTAAIPTVTTAAADDITGTTATLNGEITATGGEDADKWGFVWDDESHAAPGNVEPPATYSYSYTYTGTKGLGTFSRDITGLTKSTKYYARAFSHNSGGYGYGNEVNFTTLGDPAITTNSATSITTSTARLQSYLNSSGGATCTVRWGYGTTDKGDTIADYDTVTSYTGTWETGTSPYLDISSLDADTTYYFNVEANNGTYTKTGTVKSFSTESSVGNVSNVTAIPTDTTVTLSWNKGTGASVTKIRFMANACPSDNTTGTEIYSGTGMTYEHTGLTPGTDYCYWIKGYDATAGWSSTAVIIHCTTLAGTTETTTGTWAGFGDDFLTDPDSTNIESTFPGNPVNKAIAESLDMPINYFYFAGAMIIIIMLSFIAWKISKEPIAPAIVYILCMVIGGWQGIIPVFLAWILGFIAVGVIVIKSRSVV